MAGLQLSGGVRAGGSYNGYSPLTPASASAASSSGTTIAQQSFGITSGASSDRTIAGYGSVAVGIVAIAAMVYLWWSLPR